MSDCNGIPTLQTIKDAGTNAEVFNEVVTSTAMETTKVDSAGNKHKTLAIIDELSEQATSARDETFIARDETLAARDVTLTNAQQVADDRDTTLGYRDETLAARDVTLINAQQVADDRDTTLGYRDETLAARDVTLINAQQVADDRELVENIFEGVVDLTSTVVTNVSITRNLLKFHPIY